MCQNRKVKSSDIDDIPMQIESKDKKNNVTVLSLVSKIRKGDMILIYKDSPEELLDADNAVLAQRLYVVTGFENPSRITLVKHINAQKESDLGKGEAVKEVNQLPEKIRASINGIKFLISGVDFDF